MTVGDDGVAVPEGKRISPYEMQPDALRSFLEDGDVADNRRHQVEIVRVVRDDAEDDVGSDRQLRNAPDPGRPVRNSRDRHGDAVFLEPGLEKELRRDRRRQREPCGKHHALPPGGGEKPQRKGDDREILDHRAPAQRPRQKDAEAAAVRELQTAEHGGRGPGGVQRVQGGGRQRSAGDASSGKEPDGESQLGDRDRERDRGNGPFREGSIRAQDAGKSRHIEQLAGGRREQHQPDRDAQDELRRRLHCVLSVQS